MRARVFLKNIKEDRMKILYLLSQKPGFTGSGFYVRSLIREAFSANHDVFLLSVMEKGESVPIPHISPENSREIRFSTEELPFLIPGMSDVMPYPSTCFKNMTSYHLDLYETVLKNHIRNAVEKFRPDIIHSNHLWLMSAFAAELYPDIPIIISCHGTDIRQMNLCSHLRQRVAEGCIRADGIIALSLAQKEEISLLYGISPSKIMVAGIGFNEKLFSPAFKPPVPPVNILYAGKISFSKGVFWLLKAIEHIKAPQASFHLFLAGSGSGTEYETCLRMAKSMEDRVSLMGMLSQKELAARMKKAHIFILPSFFEGLPLVLFEALASGCRVIATDLPGTSEIAAHADQDLIRLIQLPPLETIDRPFEKDMPDMIVKLSHILTEEVGRVSENPFVDNEKMSNLIQPFTWKEVFRRIETFYAKLSSF